MAPALSFLGAAQGPLVHTAFWRLGTSLVALPLFLGFWRSTLAAPVVLSWCLLRRLLDWRVPVLLIAYLDLPLFSLALRFVDPRGCRAS